MQTRSKTNQNNNNQTTVLNRNNEIPTSVLTQMEGIRTRAQLRASASTHISVTNGVRHSPRLNGNLPDYSSFF